MLILIIATHFALRPWVRLLSRPRKRGGLVCDFLMMDLIEGRKK